MKRTSASRGKGECRRDRSLNHAYYDFRLARSLATLTQDNGERAVQTENVGCTNGDNNLENIYKDIATLTALLIEAAFRLQMFAGTEE